MSNKENPIIKIEDLTFAYPSGQNEEAFTALDHISLEIGEGSFTAIIGQNGSGKSTLARCMNALLLPSQGKILVGGYDTTDEEHLWDVRQTAGMVFQNPDNQIVSSIVEDDVAFGPENMGVEPKEIRKRVDEALEAVGMADHKRNAPHLLSGGQKQRVAIAGAIAMRPRCIIFDEPTAMLDPKGRKEIMKVIRSLHEEGITCVLITHFMDEAALAERVIVLEKGRVAMDGAPEEIFTKRNELERLGMDVPLTVELGYRLRDMGMDVDIAAVSESGFINSIKRSVTL